MKRTLRKCTISALAAALLLPSMLAANQMFPMLRVHGLGVSCSLSHDRNGNPDQDYSSGLAYRNGFFGIVSGFITSDAVWQYHQNAINGRLGIQAMILFFGAETGFSGRYDLRSDSMTPGAYIGLVGMWPVDRNLALEVSGGAVLYSDTDENELYLRTSAILNWAD